MAYGPVVKVLQSFPESLADLEFLLQCEMYERLLKEVTSEVEEEASFLRDYALLIYL